MHKNIILALSASLLLTACGGGQGGDNDVEIARTPGKRGYSAPVAHDSAGIQKIIDNMKFALSKAHIKGDAREITGFYAKDALLHGIDGPASDALGQDAIYSLFTAVYKDARLTTMNMKTDKISITPDSAIDEGHFEYVFNDPVKSRVSGKYRMLWKKGADGFWRIYEDQGTPDENRMTNTKDTVHPKSTLNLDSLTKAIVKNNKKK